MTNGPAWALQRAVHDRLIGDADLLARLGGAHVYDSVPRGRDAPYVHLADVEVRDWSTATEAGAEILLRLHVWSQQPARGEALGIAERIVALLHDAALPLDGWRLVNLRFETTGTARAGRDRRRAVLRFRAVVEPLAT